MPDIQRTKFCGQGRFVANDQLAGSAAGKTSATGPATAVTTPQAEALPVPGLGDAPPVGPDTVVLGAAELTEDHQSAADWTRSHSGAPKTTLAGVGHRLAIGYGDSTTAADRSICRAR